jgi:glucose/arabinose dehydrogenase
MGDGGSGNDPNCNAQNTGTLLGKLLRLDVDQNLNTSPYHGIPASNPFLGIAGRDEIWAYGLRNPWRFSFDRQEGDLWIADVGQGTREEIDWQPASSAGGENYGWKVREGTLCTGQTGGCSGAGVTLPACASPPLTDPVHEYLTHVNGTCAVIGGFVYRGSEIPALVGKYVFGDFCSKDVWAYDRQSDALTPLLVAPSSLFTFGERRDGELVLGVGGTVYLLARDPAAVENWAVF